MNYKIQLISLLISFLYGIFFSIVTSYNYRNLYNTSTPFKVTINIVFILDVVLLYIIIMYKINKGIFHLYFILMVILGFIVSHNKINASIKRISKKLFIEKKKNN